jgi:hypothetical protein
MSESEILRAIIEVQAEMIVKLIRYAKETESFRKHHAIVENEVMELRRERGASDDRKGT